jgi:hypothetical protein
MVTIISYLSIGKLFILLAFLSCMRKVSAQCERITTRKEVHDLSPKEIEVYRSTIRQAMKTSDPYNPSLNMWEASAKFHEELAGLIHKGAEFFYW